MRSLSHFNCLLGLYFYMQIISFTTLQILHPQFEFGCRLYVSGAGPEISLGTRFCVL